MHVTVTNPLHVEPWGVVVRTAKADSSQATLHVESAVRNDSDSIAPITLRTTVLWEGKVVARQDSNASLPASHEAVLQQDLTIREPQLWQPQAPAMYTVQTEVLEHGRRTDTVTTPFGIRTIAWSPAQGLVLNGTSIKLLGGSVHHDNGMLVRLHTTGRKSARSSC